jgi:hypothetical protein
MISKFRRLRHRVMVTQVRAPLIWLRHCGLDASDVFLASYPRSGNTWTRFLLTEILAKESASFDNINLAIPEMGIHARAQLTLPSGGRLIKTHEPYRPEYKRAVYLVRDFRDVVLSQFSRERELGMHRMSLDEYLPLFLEGRLSGFGSWQQHLPSWLDGPLASSGDMLVIRFEEMRRDPQPSIMRIVEFLGYQPRAEMVRAAIDNNSVERMRAKENAAQKLHKSTGEEGRFVRKGSVAGWREKMTESQLQLIDRHAGEVLVRLGYPLAFPGDAANGALAGTGRYGTW